MTIKNNKLSQAEEARDSLAKALYSSLFDWLVEQVNACLAPKNKGDSEPLQGLLLGCCWGCWGCGDVLCGGGAACLLLLLWRAWP